MPRPVDRRTCTFAREIDHGARPNPREGAIRSAAYGVTGGDFQACGPEPWLRILAFTGLGGAVLFGLIRAVPDAVDIIR